MAFSVTGRLLDPLPSLWSAGILTATETQSHTGWERERDCHTAHSSAHNNAVNTPTRSLIGRPPHRIGSNIHGHSRSKRAKLGLNWFGQTREKIVWVWAVRFMCWWGGLQSQCSPSAALCLRRWSVLAGGLDYTASLATTVSVRAVRKYWSDEGNINIHR